MADINTLEIIAGDGDGLKLTIPSTIEFPVALKLALDKLVSLYLAEAKLTGEPVSIGDFCWWLMLTIGEEQT
jgi:hypothetical protein